MIAPRPLWASPKPTCAQLQMRWWTDSPRESKACPNLNPNPNPNPLTLTLTLNSIQRIELTLTLTCC